MSLGSRRLTYGALADEIDALARAMLAADVVKGDRVATLQTPRPEFMVAFLAAASIGAIWVGLNPRYRLQELQYLVDDCSPRLLIARSRIGERSYATELAALMAGDGAPERLIVFDGDPPIEGAQSMSAFLVAGDGVAEDALAHARAGCGGRDPCLIVYTSGSTGKPKGALLHHGGIIAFSLTQNRVWPVDPVRVLNFLPINHIGCVIDISTPALVAGGSIAFMEQFDPSAALQAMAEERITLWGSVPSVFALQLALPEFDRHDLSSVQLILWEGAAMPREMIARLMSVHPRLATNYGLTESCSAATVLEPTADLDALADSVGAPFPGVELRLVDAEGATVADGEPGEVQIRSAYAMLGYWNRPEATAEAFTPDGFLRTGDLAVRRPDGRYRIVGRLREMYKSGGYNVYPREVEEIIETHPAVVMAAVVSRPDPLWQEVGVAFVTLQAQAGAAELTGWARERLANYKVPKRFVICESLPLLPIGKIDRKTLSERAAALAGADASDADATG